MIWHILASLRPFLSMMAAAGPPPTGKEGPSTNAILTLVCGVVSWLFLPLLAGIVGFFIGRSELRAIREGRSPRAGETITLIGYYACIANVILTFVTGCLGIAFFVAVWAGLFGAIGGAALLEQMMPQ